MRFVYILIFISIIITPGVFFVSELCLTSVAQAEGTIQGDTKKIIGTWKRQDEEYMISIDEIMENGTLNATYHNPKSINVARALFMKNQNTLKVFIELRDAGYPGSTYTLAYNSENDTLAGEYFHAGLNQNFNVIFLRKKD